MARYRFGRCELDTATHSLKVSGIVKHVEPKVFELLCLLAERAGTLVTREELVDLVWRGRVVSDSAISVRINAARRAVGDTGNEQSIIRTVPRCGFKLVPPVATAATADDDGPRPGTATPVDGAEPSDERPVLAVLPFGGIDDESYLGRGIADDLATELSRFHHLVVLSTFSTFRRVDDENDAVEQVRRLGATHVVEGSISRSGELLRLKAALTETQGRRIVWSERFDVTPEELFSVEFEIVSTIVSRLVSRLHEAQLNQFRSRPTAKPSAYECVLRGLQIYKGGEITLEEAKKAYFWFDRAVELDPDYARALAWRACAGANLWSNPPTDEELADALRDVTHALTVDPGDHEVHRLKGSIHCIVGDRETADYHLSKSVELNPNDAHILLRIGYYKSFLGDHANDLTYVDLAFKRNPLHPNWYWHDRGVVLFAHRRYEESLANLVRGGQGVEANDIYRAACHAALGQPAIARGILSDRRKVNPLLNRHWLSRAYPYRCYASRRQSIRLQKLLQMSGLD